MGDYESEISLIDAYDAGQSDTANYMSDLNDAMLLIKGDLDSMGLDPESAAKMKGANMLFCRQVSVPLVSRLMQMLDISTSNTMSTAQRPIKPPGK